jgi:hypothetical protein
MWVFAIAFGWMEAATVVYLRATSPTVVSSAIGTQFPAGWTDRFGAFLLTFGAWDLTYYVVLRLISGWPDALTNRHILFLIPAPWIGPLWAPVMVATIFVAVGSYLYWAAQRSRPYTAAMASSCSPQPEGWLSHFSSIGRKCWSADRRIFASGCTGSRSLEAPAGSCTSSDASGVIDHRTRS